jgi:uncharacterized membrane protein YcaP (DUF421 family)
VRSIIIYVLLLIIMRLMGKRQLSELQPFEFAITLIIAELACIPMAEVQIPLVYGIIPIFTLFVVHLIITKIGSKNLRFNKFLNGKPIVIMTPKGIDMRLLKQLDMNVTDLLHALRAAGYFYPSQIAYAILETDGKLSVLPKGYAAPLTPQTANITAEEVDISYPVVCEGVMQHNNMQLAKVSEMQISRLLDRYQMTVKEVMLLSVTGGKEAFLQPKQGDAIITQMPAAEGMDSDNPMSGNPSHKVEEEGENSQKNHHVGGKSHPRGIINRLRHTPKE